MLSLREVKLYSDFTQQVDFNGFPTYYKSGTSNVIWFCDYATCHFQGWVLGVADKKSATEFHPKFEDMNGRKILMRYKAKMY